MDVSVSPGTLNVDSQGNWISVTITTQGWSASDIVVASLRLDGVAPALDNGGVASTDPAGGTLTLKFPREPYGSRPDGNYLLPLSGQRADGVPLQGFAPLTVHGNGNGNSASSRRAKPHDLHVVGATGAGSAGLAIAFKLTEPTEVTLDVMDLQGRVVGKISSGVMTAGVYQREWPDPGTRVPAGMYMVRLRTPGKIGVVGLPVYR